MYVIEMHYKTHGFAKIILENPDFAPDSDFHLKPFRVIINHSGDVDEKRCKWCSLQKGAKK